MPPSDADIELQFINELDQNFKPIFDKHGDKGIAVSELKQEIKDKGLLEQMPWMNELLDKADQNSDNHMTYREFVIMMKHAGTGEERKPFQRIMSIAIANLIPRTIREDFLANYNCCPPPIFIPIISIAEIIVFIVYKYDLESRGIQTTATEGVAMYSPLVYTPARRYEAWRFLTYMFMHQGYLHITFNMVFQLLYGLSLEALHKWWRVGLVYVLGVIAGGLAHSISDHNVGLVGASGGVYALLGAHLAAIVTNWKEMNYKCLDPDEMDRNACCGIGRVLTSAPVTLVIICILVIPDTGLAIYRRVSAPEENKVGVTAHIGGFLSGVMLGIVILRNINTLTWEVTLGWITLAIYVAFVTFCCLFNTFYDGYPKTDFSGY